MTVPITLPAIKPMAHVMGPKKLPIVPPVTLPNGMLRLMLNGRIILWVKIACMPTKKVCVFFTSIMKTSIGLFISSMYVMEMPVLFFVNNVSCVCN